MTEKLTNCSSMRTLVPESSERCPDCKKPLNFDGPVDTALLAAFTVLCDACAERRTRRMEQGHAADALRGRFREHVRKGWVAEDLQGFAWGQSAPEIEAMNVAAWREARSWHRLGEKNLYLHGAVGVGKTWAARACLREAFVHGKNVAEVTARRLCKVAESYREGDGLFAAWKGVSVLLIDDLDKAAWTQERVDGLWELLDARTTSRKRTIVCSNLDSGPLLETLKAACAHQGQRNESHAVATLDRLKPITKLHFEGKSRRGHA